ncbi:MAG: glycosyltransferase family 4 protein [Planctomycetes bacterium]|nr:glycosyltransferase family 4 protein [Planctomycetota bacterium]
MAERLCLPVLIGKLLRKRVILNLAAHCPTVTRNDPDFIVRAAARLELLNYAIADKIILYSPNLIKEWDLEQYKNKTLIASRHYLNFDKFTNQKSLQERDPYVGYAGRLSEEKGVLNLIQAGPGILKNQVDMKLLIGGDGYLQQSIEDFLSEVEWADMVQLLGWIPHDELPDFLNQLKLLVLPSYTEGLPNVMLEAMACGTPVLATPVGAVPDIIKDGLTGFIMEDNSPNCIAKNIARAFKHPDLQQIANNARDLVERQFTYEAAMKQYNNLFNDLQSEN